MTESSTISLDRLSPHIAKVTFSNSPANLIVPETVSRLHEIVVGLSEDPDIKVVLFTSSLSEFFFNHFDLNHASDFPILPGAEAKPIWTDLVVLMTEAPFISIASIRGRTRGGGNELTLAFDLRYASREKAIFGQPEVGTGILPGGGGSERLPRLVGRDRALEAILSSDDYDADLAEKWGWVTRALPDAELDGFVDKLAARLASFDRQALAAGKAQINRASLPPQGDLFAAYGEYVGSLSWSGFQARLPGFGQRIAEKGLVEIELNLGAYIGGAKAATARAFFPNGLADIAQPEAQEKMHIDGGPIGIAVLDDYQHAALSLADWSSLKPWASITIFHDHLAEADAVVARLKPFAVVCVMRERTPLTRDILQRLPSLKLIASTAPRNASIDTDTADRQGIKVVHTGYTSTPTVELTWALILGSARHIASEGESLRRGGWQQSVGDDLSGKTLAVLGLGNVGREVARIGLAFGMNVIAWSENLTPERAAAAGAELVSKEALFKQADFLSVHLVLSQRTRGLVGAEELSLMKSTARLINTSRGPIVTESDLVEALRARKIAGAAIDVFDQEPLPPNHPFRTMTNVLATPHIGYVSRGLYETFYRDTVANIRRWLEESSTG